MSVQVIGLCHEGPDNALPGAATAPALLRWGAESAEARSLFQQRAAPAVDDHGDKPFLGLAPDDALDAMESALGALDPARPFLVLGGDHAVTLPILRWHLRTGAPAPRVIHLDAHLDRRSVHEGVRASHATVIKRVEELLGPQRVASFGVRSRAPEEPWDEARCFAYDVAAPLERWLAGIDPATPLYLTLDLDVLDPGAMPAVSNPEPGGIDARALFEALALLRGRLAGADLVELVPTAAPPAAAAQQAGIVYRELLVALAGS